LESLGSDLAFQIQKVVSDLMRENEFFDDRDMGVYLYNMIDLLREICKPVLKMSTGIFEDPDFRDRCSMVMSKKGLNVLCIRPCV
jgi:hypothetical protein